MFSKESYEVCVSVRIKCKIKTVANDSDEAYDNVRNDFENMSFEEFVSEYGVEADDYSENWCDAVDLD